MVVKLNTENLKEQHTSVRLLKDNAIGQRGIGMEKRIKMPEGAAELLYKKVEAMSTARAALMISLPSDISEDEAREYYSKAFSDFILAGVDFKKYEFSLMQSIGVKSYIRAEGAYMIVEEDQ